MKRSLKQIAEDMRAASALLAEGADEIESVLSSINLDALNSLLGTTGGGTPERPPFVPKPAESKPSKLTKEQKLEIRRLWSSLPEPLRNDQNRNRLAARFKISTRRLMLIAINDPKVAAERLKQARAAKAARHAS